MKKFRDLKQLKDILTNEDFENNKIELQFRNTNTTFYYVINNIYAIYNNNRAIGLYDANDNFVMGDLETSFTKAGIWDNIIDNDSSVYYFVSININNFLNKKGLISGTEDLFASRKERNNGYRSFV